MAAKRRLTSVDVSKTTAVCPLLVPLDATGRTYDGLITACGQDFRLRILLPIDNRISAAEIEGDLTLMKYVGSKKSVVEQRFRSSKDLPGFLKELQILLESQLQNDATSISATMKPSNYYSKIIEDANDVGWERICYVDSTLTEFHVKFLDKREREHILRTKFPSEYPDAKPSVSADLPTNFDFHWTKTKTFLDLCQQFQHLVDSFQMFWDVLDEVDQEFWVLEPEKPHRNDTTRRIALGKGSSLLFTIDPKNPTVRPSWQLIGIDDVLESFQRTLTLNFPKWDDMKSVVENWKTILPIEFPSPKNATKEDIRMECGICYAYKLEDQIPDQMCKDQRCNKQFHSACLYEWLRSLQTSRQSFDVIFGECPYCSKMMSCKVCL